MDFITWLGRFHPAVVHFPIGILVLGAIFHYLDVRKPSLNLVAATRTIYFIGFISAAFAAFAGWVLAKEGGYQASTIFWHRWLGIGMAVLAFVLWWYYRKPNSNKRQLAWGALALFLGLMFTGHLGGELTHGDSYLLEKAPGFVKNIFNYEDPAKHPVINDPDSTYVYRDLLEPVFEKKCWTCHNGSLQKGGLDMSTEEALLEGGRNGDVIEGTAENSELFKRVVMDPNSRKYMPPKGVALSYQEIKMLEWWLDMGAPFDQTVVEVETPQEIKDILMSRHQLDTKPKSFLEKTTVDEVSEKVMNDIAEAGFSIRPISMNTNFVDVKWKSMDSVSLAEAIPALEGAAEQIAWLDIGHSNVTDDMLRTVGKLTNLVRVRLEDNPITDEGVKHLTSLSHLESLNLYKTKITDICAPEISKLKSLKRLFVWQTDFGEEGAAALNANLPDVEVVLGYNVVQAAN